MQDLGEKGEGQERRWRWAVLGWGEGMTGGHPGFSEPALLKLPSV